MAEVASFCLGVRRAYGKMKHWCLHSWICFFVHQGVIGAGGEFRSSFIDARREASVKALSQFPKHQFLLHPNKSEIEPDFHK